MNMNISDNSSTHEKDDNDDDRHFSQGISDLFVTMEELRQSITIMVHKKNTNHSQGRITVDILLQWQYNIDRMVQIMDYLWQQCNDTNSHKNNINMEMEMLQHTIQKAFDVTQQVLQLCCTQYIEPTATDDDDDDTDENGTSVGIEEQRRIGQGCVARITEMTIVIGLRDHQNGTIRSSTPQQTDNNHNNNNDGTSWTDDLVQSYVEYQKRTLRQRCKPAIAQLVQIRCQQQQQQEQQKQQQQQRWTTTNQHKDAVVSPFSTTSRSIYQHHPSTTNCEDDQDADTSATFIITTPLQNNNHNDTNTPITLLQQLPTPPQQHHAPVFTIVLGVAATLIHPLATWMSQLDTTTSLSSSSHVVSSTVATIIHRLCQQAIQILDEQTQTLIQTLSDWFYHDWKHLLQDDNGDDHDNRSATVSSLLPPSSSCSQDPTTITNQYTKNSSDSIQQQQYSSLLLLGHFNTTVDEMAYIAQILERYRTLMDSCSRLGGGGGAVHHHHENNSNMADSYDHKKNVIATQILPEWIWQYSSLERRLVQQQWQMSVGTLVLPSSSHNKNVGGGSTATGTAVPVCIVIGTEIRVSSCIEDAQYITTRAMERAISTQSLHAIATVAYAITHDIWTTEVIPHNHAASPKAITTVGIYQALLEEVGCWSVPDEATSADSKKKDIVSSPSSGGGGFAAALLDALDDDLLDQAPISSKFTSSGGSAVVNSTTPSKAPLSGGTHFLSSLISSTSSAVEKEQTKQRQIDTLYCVLNSMYASTGACRSLADTLAEILDDHDIESEPTTIERRNDEQNNDTRSVPETTPPFATAQDAMTKKAITMIQLTRDEVLQYSARYQQLLSDRVEEAINLWCWGSGDDGINTGSNGPTNRNNCLTVLRDYFEKEWYNIDGPTLSVREADERLLNELINPLQQSQLLHQFVNKCEAPILQIVSEQVATIVVDMILNVLWNTTTPMNGSDHQDIHNNSNHILMDDRKTQKSFTDWGALLLSKQSRMLQQYISTSMIQPSSSDNGSTTASTDRTSSSSVVMTTTTCMSVLQIWERLSQVITILQLEKPMDWMVYYHTTSILTADEISRTLHLRIDFPNDAIEKVVSNIRSSTASTTRAS
jgi:hypothetical protein